MADSADASINEMESPLKEWKSDPNCGVFQSNGDFGKIEAFKNEALHAYLRHVSAKPGAADLIVFAGSIYHICGKGQHRVPDGAVLRDFPAESDAGAGLPLTRCILIRSVAVGDDTYKPSWMAELAKGDSAKHYFEVGSGRVAEVSFNGSAIDENKHGKDVEKIAEFVTRYAPENTVIYASGIFRTDSKLKDELKSALFKRGSYNLRVISQTAEMRLMGYNVISILERSGFLGGCKRVVIFDSGRGSIQGAGYIRV